MTLNQFIDNLNLIKGKIIAIVYNFPPDSLEGAKKYDFWEGDVISDWVHAVYELHGMPFILDARTFVEKAMNKTLPPIDYVIDLNDGFYNLSSLSLIPSACAYCNIPCIPCDAFTLLIGENKFFTNVIARAFGLNIPNEVKEEREDTITRPYCWGSSCGINKGVGSESLKNKIIQEFVPGFDVTIPLIFCPISEELTVLPAIAYCHTNYDPMWFLGETQKRTHSEYKKRIVDIDKKTEMTIKKFAEYMGIHTYCRLDFRCLCETGEEIKRTIEHGVSYEKLKFIEINPLPTIKEGINFLTSLSQTPKTSLISDCINAYYTNTREATLVGFILSISIIAHIKAKH